MPENKLNDETVLRRFIDKLIADKGGDTLDAKQKETLQGELYEELDARMQSAMIRALPDAKLMELEKMLDAEAPDEEIESFFANAGVSFDAPLRKVMSDFRDDYFTGKMKVSVKTELKPEAVDAGAVVNDTATVVGEPVTSTPAGQPVQGAVSAAPGASNAEGVADTTNAAVQGQAQPAQTEVLAQGANVVQAQAVQQPAGQAQVAQPVMLVQPVVAASPAAAVAPAPETMVPKQVEQVPQGQILQGQTPQSQTLQGQAPQETPLQAAPNLMDALNTATANLNVAAANLGATDASATNSETVNPGVANPETVNPGVANAAAVNPGVVNDNTEMTGKEA